MYCEVQVMLSDFVDVRSSMHEVYKAWRADSHEALASDFMRSVGQGARAPDPDIGTDATNRFVAACTHGMLTEAEAAFDSAKYQVESGAGFQLQVDGKVSETFPAGGTWQQRNELWVSVLKIAIVFASWHNHVDVLSFLLDRSPPLSHLFPRRAGMQHENHAITGAAQGGFTAIVRMLLMGGAYADPMTAAGSGSNSYITPIIAAVHKGYDVTSMTHPRDITGSPTSISVNSRTLMGWNALPLPLPPT